MYLRTSLMATVLLCSTTLSAAPLIDLSVGAQLWTLDTDGGYSNDANLVDYTFDTNNNGAAYIAFEHPVFLIPNVKVGYANLDNQGFTTVSSNYEFGGQVFASDSVVDTDLSLSSTDIILYYELLDIGILGLDVGLNAKLFDGELSVVDRATNSQGQESFSGAVPTLYSKLDLQLPLTGLGAYAEGSFFAIDDHEVSDYQIAIYYSFVDYLALELNLQLGYRSTTVTLDDLDGIYTDVEFSGGFAGIEFHF